LALFIKYLNIPDLEMAIFSFLPPTSNYTIDKELEMLVTVGHNEEEHSREELLVDILWIVMTREFNNKYRKL